MGDIVGGDNVYLEEKSKAGYVFSPILRTSKDVTVTQLATSVLTATGSLRAGIVTIYNGGEVSIPRGSKINELRLGSGVPEPGMLVKLGIKKVVSGDFPVPTEWQK